MSVSGKDKAVVKAFWEKAGPKSAEIGAEALSRMLTVYPQTKTYFSHWSDLTPGSAQVRKHGATIMSAVGDAVARIDELVPALANLSELHAFKLRVDPANFRVSYSIYSTYSCYRLNQTHTMSSLLEQIRCCQIFYMFSIPTLKWDFSLSLYNSVLLI
uniref:Hemoglobin subunit alpha-A-like n=1 Tax=Mastacembelus armatus TaxID=205130 RepID=A0A7N8Y148_9TELE